MFVTGPAFAGKRAFVRNLMGWDEKDLALHAVWDVQELANTESCAREEDIASLSHELATHDVVIANEVGGGVVPMDAAQRAQREVAGRLACLLAQEATCVVRICCGLPQVLKGEMP